MVRPSAHVVSAARKAAKGMADRNTPFIFDEWYVAAFTEEISRHLLPRMLLGKRIVFYRTENGEAVALEDRCAHRSYPLSAGTLEGNTIVCGYHGFRYDSVGNCVNVPSLKACPKSIGVKRYPLIEIGPIVWIWMGDPEKASKSKIPDVSFVDSPTWVWSKGYFHLPGNYVSLHENLLDLTHLSFVHAKSFGTPDYAGAPYKTEYGDGRFKVTREVNPTLLPAVWAEPSGLSGVNSAVRIATSEFLSPAYHRVSTSFFDGALPDYERLVCSIRTAHLA